MIRRAAEVIAKQRRCSFGLIIRMSITPSFSKSAKAPILRPSSFHLRVNMADHEKLPKTIVCPDQRCLLPNRHIGFRPQCRGSRDVIEIALTTVVVKNIAVFQVPSTSQGARPLKKILGVF